MMNSLQKFHLVFPGKVLENSPEHINYIVFLSKEIIAINHKTPNLKKRREKKLKKPKIKATYGKLK